MRQSAAVPSSLKPAFAGAAATSFRHWPGEVRLRAPVSGHGGRRLGDGSRGRVLGAMNLAGYLIGVLGGRTLAGARERLARSIPAWDSRRSPSRLAPGTEALRGWRSGAWSPAWQADPHGPRRTRGAGRGCARAARHGRRDRHRRRRRRRHRRSLAVPALLPAGLSAAWLGLAVLVLGLWSFARPRWPQTPVAALDAAAPRPKAITLILAYGLAGAGMVPHMVYFVDLAVRGRGLDPRLGALTWLLFGIGTICGTLLGGRAADRWGGAARSRSGWRSRPPRSRWRCRRPSPASPLPRCSAASGASASPPLRSRAPANSQVRRPAWCGCARPPSSPWRRPRLDSCWCRCSHTPARMRSCSPPASRHRSQRCWSRPPTDRRWSPMERSSPVTRHAGTATTRLCSALRRRA